MKRTTSSSELGPKPSQSLAAALPRKPLASSEIAIPLKPQRLRPFDLPGTPPVPASPLSALLLSERLAQQASTSAPAVVLRPRHGGQAGGTPESRTPQHNLCLVPPPGAAAVVALNRRSGATCRLTTLRTDTSGLGACFFSIGSRPTPLPRLLESPEPQPEAAPAPLEPLHPTQPVSPAQLGVATPPEECPRRVCAEGYAADDLDGDNGFDGQHDGGDEGEAAGGDEGWGND